MPFLMKVKKLLHDLHGFERLQDYKYPCWEKFMVLYNIIGHSGTYANPMIEIKRG